MTPRRRLREVVDVRDPGFRKAYHLLRQTFPPSELVRIEEFRRTLRERRAGVWADQHWHMVIAEREGRVQGVATGTYLGSLNIGLIGYLAVGRRLRSGGLGPDLRGRLLRAFDADAMKSHGHKMEALIGEVEPDNPWLRRLVRYHGAIPLDLPYFQPPVRPTEPEVALVLYYQPLRRVRKKLPVAFLRRLLYAIWRRAYRVHAPVDDARFRKMLRALDDRKWVGARELPPIRRRGPLHE